MSEHRPIHCLFYSHVWAIHMLKQFGLENLEKQVIIELAQNSNLAPVFAEQAKPRYGLSGLLHLAGRLEQLSKPFKYVPAPLVLAPRPEISVAALNCAVALLPTTPTQYAGIVLLVHIEEAAHFVSSYAHVTRFSLAWDLADVPGSKLVELADLLVKEQLISEENWGGIHLYSHPNRKLEDAAQRDADFKAILQEYPLLSGAH